MLNLLTKQNFVDALKESLVREKACLHEAHQYQLALLPSAEVMCEIEYERGRLVSEYGFESLPDPWIWITCFTAREEMEETIIRYMRRVFSMERRFALALINYSGIPEKSILLRVQDPSPLRRFFTNLKPIHEYLAVNGCHVREFNPHPGILMAAGMKESVYRKLMFEYSQKLFYGCFEVSQLVLYRRLSEYATAEKVTVFGLS